MPNATNLVESPQCNMSRKRSDYPELYLIWISADEPIVASMVHGFAGRLQGRPCVHLDYC